MKKITLLCALFVASFSFAQTFDVKINGKTVDDFLASTNPANTFPINTTLNFEFTHSNLPVPSGNDPGNARIVVRFYQPQSTPSVFENAVYQNGFTAGSATPIVQTLAYTPTNEVSNYTLQIFPAGATSLQIQKFNISVGAATLSNETFSASKLEAFYSSSKKAIVMNNIEDFGKFSIFNIMGQSVLKGEISKEINVETLKSGLYFLSTEKGSLKFVK